MTSQEERDRLKEEYKAHYRSIQQTRKKLAESERVAKIAKTLRDMNADHLLESMDTVLRTVREKIEIAEVKLDMAMQARDAQDLEESTGEEIPRESPQETVRRIKADMGLLQDEMERTVKAIKANKTLGPKLSK
jgi:hypothetical protein